MDVLKSEVLSLKSVSPEKVVEVSNLIDKFRLKILTDFQNFEKQWFQEFKNTWKQKLMPNMRSKYLGLHCTKLY
ncbi:hypothetical protein CCY16_00296 [Wolbachia endosymbiont of Wuchereria bancrofti]|nr:hypothetical protein CCY16_00296 [Wolbachia endosymbiont of Wuchereria bancrofti]